MLALLSAPGTSIFVAALVLMPLIGVIEALGLGGSTIGLDLHAETHLEGPGDLIGWLGVGRLPLLMLLIVFLAVFGCLGLAGQQWAAATFGAPASPWIAGPVTAILSLPLTGIAARGLARILPRDETSAVDLDELVGRRATVTVGRAAVGFPARARVEDRYGQAHFVMVEPQSASERFGEGDEVLLVRREDHRFIAIGEADGFFKRLGC